MTKIITLSILLAASAVQYPAHASDAEDSFYLERKAMVAFQVKQRGVSDRRVIQALESVPRHEFVPITHAELAYTDRPLPIGYGQTISQPYIVGFMSEALELEGNERVLEIGTGSGYQAAILSKLTKKVFSIEIVPELGEQAKRHLQASGYANVEVRIGDGYQGWPDQAPFDAIIVTAAPPEIPQTLIDQLKVPGGRMIVPVGNRHQELVLITRTQKGVTKKSLLPVRFVPMVRGKRP